jgi:hypothetical protein
VQGFVFLAVHPVRQLRTSGVFAWLPRFHWHGTHLPSM